MKEDKKSIQQKIILATITCIEKKGIQEVTNRDIAKEAKVNSAAINYYFGTKENLLEEVMKQILHSAFSDWNEVVGEHPQSTYKALKIFLNHWLEGMLHYPNISKSTFYDPLLRNDYSGIFMKHFNDFLCSLNEKLNASAFKNENTSFSIMQIMSTIIFVGLLPKLFQGYSPVNFADTKQREEYVEHLLKHFLKDDENS